MADLIQIEELRTYLVDEGVVQLPDDTGDLPVVWLNPRDGAPEPAGDVDTTVTLRQSGYVTREPLEEFLEEVTVDVIVRARQSPVGQLVQRQIRELLDKPNELTTMGDLVCEWVKLWRGFQVLGADKTSYTTLSSYRIAARVKALQGLPYAP